MSISVARFICLLQFGQIACPYASQDVSTNAFLKRDTKRAELQVTDEQLTRMKTFLEPLFVALPKNGHGVVGASAASYALHRLFAQQYGINIKGVWPSNGRWAERPNIGTSDDAMPERISDVFHSHPMSDGLQLQELVVLAAELEQVIYHDANERLIAAYRAHELSLHGEGLTPEQVDAVLDTFLESYILNHNSSDMTPATVPWLSEQIVKTYPAWLRIRHSLRETQSEILSKVHSASFADVKSVVDEVVMRFGQWQNDECRAVRSKLVELEDVDGQGRVQLAAFYGSTVHDGSWQFIESEEYLDQLGAIDDSTPGYKRVIIPNYLYSPANWIASSSFHSTGCMSECDSWMDLLERGLAAPRAIPAQILQLVDTFPVDSQLKGKAPQSVLVARLHEIAERHGGLVPIHGRLFAQWLHHAFPRECPYPHPSGKIDARSAREWEQTNGKEAFVSQEHILQHVSSQTVQGRRICEGDVGLCATAWSTHEELLDSESFYANYTQWKEQARACSLLLALGSIFVGLVRTFRQILAETFPDRKEEPREVYFI